MDFENEILKINENLIESGEIEEIIQSKLHKAYEDAISECFRWGAVRDAIKNKLSETLVPAIEQYDMDKFAVKIDTFMTEIAKNSCEYEVKTIMENAEQLFCREMPEEVDISTILYHYSAWIERDIDCTDREINYDDSPSYYSGTCTAFVRLRWSSPNNLLLELNIGEDEKDEQRAEYTRTIPLRKPYFHDTGDESYRIDSEIALDCRSISDINMFDLWILALQRRGTRIVTSVDDWAETEFIPQAKPEPSWN